MKGNSSVNELNMARQYEATRRYKYLCAGATTIEDMIEYIEKEATLLKELQQKGVWLQEDGAQEDDYAKLITDSFEVVMEYEHLGWGYWEGDPEEGMTFITLTGLGNEWQEENN